MNRSAIYAQLLLFQMSFFRKLLLFAMLVFVILFVHPVSMGSGLKQGGWFLAPNVKDHPRFIDISAISASDYKERNRRVMNR